MDRVKRDDTEPEGWVLYDAGCGVCARWVPFWARTLERLGLAISPLQAPWVAARVNLSPDALLADIRLLLRDGRQFVGADVYRYVMRRLWWAYPLYLLAAAPGLRPLFERAYRAFADHRLRISAACGLDQDASGMMARPMTEHRLLEKAYDAFNARDVEAALATMHADVAWPNGMEGGHVSGHSGVRDYWTRQWGVIDPHVEPLRFEADATGRVVVDVHQVVRDRAGNLVKDEIVQHVYLIEGGLIRSMEIRKPSTRSEQGESDRFARREGASSGHAG